MYAVKGSFTNSSKYSSITHRETPPRTRKVRMNPTTLEGLRAMNREFPQEPFPGFFPPEYNLAKLRVYMLNPADFSDDPEALEIGRREFNNLPSHPCYWNDRFCVAILCNMPFEFKRNAAWAIVKNGKRGYFEWNTHFGFEMRKIFTYLGIRYSPPSEQPLDGYFYLHGEIIRQLAMLFDLPTRENLNENEQCSRRGLEKVFREHAPIA